MKQRHGTTNLSVAGEEISDALKSTDPGRPPYTNRTMNWSPKRFPISRIEFKTVDTRNLKANTRRKPNLEGLRALKSCLNELEIDEAILATLEVPG